MTPRRMHAPAVRHRPRRRDRRGRGRGVRADGLGQATARRARPRQRGRAAPPTGALGAGRADRTLVVVELGGGNDGLCTVVPTADPAYRRLRPTLAVPDAIALDGSVGLHPKLVKLVDAVQGRAGGNRRRRRLSRPEPLALRVARVLVGGHTGGGRGNVGWLGRYLDGTVGFDDPSRRSASVRCRRPRCSATSRSRRRSPTRPVSSPRARVGRHPGRLIAAWWKFTPASPDPATLLGQVQEAIHLTVKARSQLDADLTHRPVFDRAE